MVAAGMGLGIVPELAALPNLLPMKLKMIRLSDGWAKRKLMIGVRDLKTLSAPARTLHNHLLRPITTPY